MKKRIVVLASGGGSHLKFLVQACENKTLNAEIVGLISHKKDSLSLEKAKNYFIQGMTITAKNKSLEAWDKELTDKAKSFNPDLIILSGFMLKIRSQFLNQFQNKIINIHPSLLPKYGGEGMFGSRVHKAVVEAKEKESGVTVHWVNEDYDSGLVIAQKKLALSKNETPESLEKKIKSMEGEFLVSCTKEVIKKL